MPNYCDEQYDRVSLRRLVKAAFMAGFKLGQSDILDLIPPNEMHFTNQPYGDSSDLAFTEPRVLTAEQAWHDFVEHSLDWQGAKWNGVVDIRDVDSWRAL